MWFPFFDQANQPLSSKEKNNILKDLLFVDLGRESTLNKDLKSLERVCVNSETEFL